ncbi:DUF4141 domain-containing protein [Elizabethkingia anophelis]|uniref:Conjugative transposon protein TraI n=1 Tax=Elizabethkingia anophelis TaxID=1117645 RepID=A0A494JAD2_9FLAO|nr:MULTISPECIES: DUF4141 domain-containing protein [Elizabethkingia]AQX52762.1 hypothetical protein AYC66_11890 [Elizabethkingia anophelis]MCT4196677.1 DUF4141 domain-containing protein [Elizabethkingia anophelis]MCT4225379.1 DUF4141 domain-containing protein [Elizabethkingia anophelis]MCT4306970.1 DUF4141 domain-containing protein [Elizabethkingia anophelis]MDV2472729.1 DUF4141 domain-containing protein [Elizabethkingia anophelis]
MKKIMLQVLLALSMAITPKINAQWIVSDPSNLAQGILNSANEIAQTSSTASNMIKNFNEVKKVYDQGKEYYDKLKAVNNLIKDARKVQQTLLLVGDISNIYVNSFEKMLRDTNFRPEELLAIANGYAKLLSESTALLKEIKEIVSVTSLSLNDKERMEIIDRVYKEVKDYHGLVSYYTRKNISVSMIRSKKRNSTQRVLDLYGNTSQKYW